MEKSACLLPIHHQKKPQQFTGLMQLQVLYRRYGRGRLLARDIAIGLAFLHAHDIIHFDIKSKCATAHKPPR